MSTAFIVTKKEYCPFCEKAKNLLDLKGIDYVEKVIGIDYTKDELLVLVPGAKSVPQIFIDDDHIGGCDDLVKYFQMDA
jgi:glutaredoxin 3